MQKLLLPEPGCCGDPDPAGSQGWYFPTCFQSKCLGALYKHTLFVPHSTSWPTSYHLSLQDKQCHKQEGKKIAGVASKIICPTQSRRRLVFSAVLHLFGFDNCCVPKQMQHKWAAVSATPEVLASFYLKSNTWQKKSPKSLLSSQPPQSLWSVPRCDFRYSMWMLRHLLKFIFVATKLGQFSANKKKEKKNPNHLFVKLLRGLSKESKMYIIYILL